MSVTATNLILTLPRPGWRRAGPRPPQGASGNRVAPVLASQEKPRLQDRGQRDEDEADGGGHGACVPPLLDERQAEPARTIARSAARKGAKPGSLHRLQAGDWRGGKFRPHDERANHVSGRSVRAETSVFLGYSWNTAFHSRLRGRSPGVREVPEGVPVRETLGRASPSPGRPMSAGARVPSVSQLAWYTFTPRRRSGLFTSMGKESITACRPFTLTVDDPFLRRAVVPGLRLQGKQAQQSTRG